jgi:hypothetical protein
MGTNPESEIRDALDAIRTAHMLLAMQRDTLARIERERQHLESVGPVLAPGLFLRAQREPWRKPVGDAVRAAIAFDRAITSALAELAPIVEEA